MIKTWYSNSAEYKIMRKTTGLSRFLIFLKYPQAGRARKTLECQENYLSRILSGNSSNDILISCSGQEKIDKLVSCQDLGGCDFIVF